MPAERRRRTRASSAGTVEGSLAGGSSGESHTSSLWLVVTLVVFGIAWFVFSTIQITGTIQAVYNFLSITTTVTPQTAAQDLVKMQSGQLGQNALIANSIGWAVQIVLLAATFPSEHYIAWHIGRARGYVMGFLIGADWITDSLYVLQGHTVFNGFLHFAPGALGLLIVAVLYPIAVTSITVFAGVELAHRVDRIFGNVRARLSWLG